MIAALHSSKSRHRTRGFLLVLLAFGLLTGCIRVDMDVVLHEDNTAGGQIIFAIDDASAVDLGLDPQQTWDMYSADILADWPDWATQEPYVEDGYTGTRLIIADASVDDLYNVTGQPLSIVRDGDYFSISGELNMHDQIDANNVDATLADNMDIQISITCPGRILESNGTIRGNTVSWHPSATGDNVFSARCSALDEPVLTEGDIITGAQTIPWWIPVLGLALLASLIWLGLTLRRRSHYDRHVEDLGLDQFHDATEPTHHLYNQENTFE